MAIAGVYAMVPYISGAYGWNESDQLAESPSLVQNNGWFLNTTMMDVLVWAYDADDIHRHDPLAWPYFATVDDLAGLPPHVISVKELDPVRDEALPTTASSRRPASPQLGESTLASPTAPLHLQDRCWPLR